MAAQVLPEAAAAEITEVPAEAAAAVPARKPVAGILLQEAYVMAAAETAGQVPAEALAAVQGPAVPEEMV